jgi:hypothetical protein
MSGTGSLDEDYESGKKRLIEFVLIDTEQRRGSEFCLEKKQVVEQCRRYKRYPPHPTRGLCIIIRPTLYSLAGLPPSTSQAIKSVTTMRLASIPAVLLLSLTPISVSALPTDKGDSLDVDVDMVTRDDATVQGVSLYLQLSDPPPHLGTISASHPDKRSEQ